MIAATVCLNDEDIQALKELKSLVDDLELRMVPSESKTNIDRYL